jgi:hypothetical protein
MSKAVVANFTSPTSMHIPSTKYSTPSIAPLLITSHQVYNNSRDI